MGKAMEGHVAQGRQVTLWGSDSESKTSPLDDQRIACLGRFTPSRCDCTGVAGVLGGLTRKT